MVKKTKKYASILYKSKCMDCSLHFVVLSYYDNKVWKCPECGGDNLAIYKVYSDNEIYMYVSLNDKTYFQRKVVKVGKVKNDKNHPKR